MKNKKLPQLLTFFVVLLISVAGEETRAQNPAGTISLSANQQRLSRLAPGQASGQVVFAVDAAGQITIEVVATIATLDTSIVGPGGQVISPATIGGLGGEFMSVEGGPAGSVSILGMMSPGFHYIYVFPSLGAGNYTVRFDAGPSLAQEVAVISKVITDSPIQAALFATDPNLVIGSAAVLTAAVFAGSTPVAGASVTVDVVPPSGPVFTLSLKDDGASASGDDAAGDGLYSAQFVPAITGAFRAAALISGTTGGTSFVRNGAASFNVIPQNGRLTGIVTDQGIDDNGDTLFDRVAIDVQTNISVAGKFAAFVHLKTASGKSLVRSSEVTLTTGIQLIRVNFEAADFLALGENGPYTIELIELLRIDPVTGSSPADIIANVGQTQAYLLSQFQRPAASLTGNTSDQGVDDNGNGKFDRLLVSVQVEVLRSGFYSWGFKLTNQNAQEIDFASGSAFFNAGLNNLNVTFNGTKIGAFGANGPYELRDLLLQGPGTSLVVIDLGRTQPYQFTQFEGAKGNQAPGLNVTPASQSVQYSDSIGTVTLTASDAETASSALTIATTWSKNGGSSSPGLPASFTLTDAGVNGSGQRVWTISGVTNVDAGAYTITSIVTDDGSGSEPPQSSQATVSIIVNKEDVATAYTGDLNVFTAGPKVSTATVRLAANLTQEADGSPGDLTLARVVFELFRAGNVGSTPDLTVGPLAVPSSGQVLTIINLDVDLWTVKVRIEENGFWTSPVEIALLNVSLGGDERGATGGGWISDGGNRKSNFGFNVGYLKNGNVKGNSVFTYRGSDGFTYLVKSTSWQGGGLNLSAVNNVISRASFSGKCVVQKISDSGVVVESFAGSFTVDVNDGDLHTPRVADGYAITILDNKGNIFRQVGGVNNLLPLGGGNIQVHSK